MKGTASGVFEAQQLLLRQAEPPEGGFKFLPVRNWQK
jgi:hypothetical protein